MSVLCIIPARGGSKRVPRKVLQQVDGKPLLQYAIDIARGVPSFEKAHGGNIIVSTDDPEVAAYARLRGVEVLTRPSDLATDDSTILDVAGHAAKAYPQYDDICILQPTCPLIHPVTIERMLLEFSESAATHLVAGAPEAHLFWQAGIPLTPRWNSQRLGDLAPRRETGLQVMTRHAALTGEAVTGMFLIPPEQALDIDTHADLAMARHLLSRKTIRFNVVASDAKGSGHLRRCLQLTEALSYHRIEWTTYHLEGWAVQEAEHRGVNLMHVPRREMPPDLIISDALDKRVYPGESKLVVFEPEGDAAKYADLVIDEFQKPKYAIMRPEFLCLPRYVVRPHADKVLVTFGGTDPTRMNERVSRIVQHSCDLQELDVLSAGHPGSMAEAMSKADLVITSQGRTVHEAAAVGVPCISIAVNERESRHSQLPGVVYLGLGHTLSDAHIADVVNRTLLSYPLRHELSETSHRQIDGKGLRRVVSKIENLLEEL